MQFTMLPTMGVVEIIIVQSGLDDGSSAPRHVRKDQDERIANTCPWLWNMVGQQEVHIIVLLCLV